MIQAIGIPKGIDSAPFWPNDFLHSYEEEYMSSLISSDIIKSSDFHSTKGFIHDLRLLHDGRKFARSISDIYPEELELDVAYQGICVTF